jgi:hypothetical protein
VPVSGLSAQLGSAPVNRFDATVGSDFNAALLSIAVARHWSVLREGRVRAGLGVRWTAFLGGDYRLSSAERSAIAANRVDSVFIQRPWQNAINLAAHLTMQPSERWAFGANLDLIGLGFGTSHIGRLRLLSGPPEQEISTTTARRNLFLVGTRDRGTLASEFFVAYDVRRNIRLRAGLNHFVFEHVTPTPGTDGGTRYRRFGNAAFVGISRLLR